MPIVDPPHDPEKDKVVKKSIIVVIITAAIIIVGIAHFLD